MNNNELESKIRSEIENMPTKACRVAEYILNNSSELAFLSIGEVAEKLGVSKAQLVRVARMLGFDGYSALKSAVKNNVITRLTPVSLAKKNKSDNLSLEILSLEHANIDETAASLSAGDIEQFCESVKNAGSIYCVGWGISAIVAENLYTRLIELGLSGILMKRGSMALTEQVRAVKANDLIVVCELPSYVIEVTESIRYAREKGAKIITMTDSPAAPVCRSADVRFHLSDATKTFGSSIVSAIFLVHVLTSALADSLGDKVKEALKAQREGLADERIYYTSFSLKY